MAKSFNIAANLVIKGPPNLRPLITQIRTQLNSIQAQIQLRLAPATITNVGNLNTRITQLNRNLTLLQGTAGKATTILQQLGAAFASMTSNAASVATSMRTITTSVQRAGAAARNSGTQISLFGELIGVSAKRFAAFTVAASAVGSFVFSIGDGFRQAIKFQRELVKLVQVGDDSAVTIRGVEKEITKLATTLGVSSQSLVEASVTLRQAGLSAQQTTKALETLAKTELAPTFDNIAKTTDGVIAVMAQFKVQAKDLDKIFGSLNTVSAAYAVESGDLIESVKRSGGAFRAAGGNIQEFLALITTVRATTRESAETIATGLRTISARLQRPQTIQFFKDLNISLEDANKNFVGPYKAIERISQALKNIPTSSKTFAGIVEEIGGIRQQSKVIPLLKEITLREEAYKTALTGETSLTKNAITAQDALAIKLTKVKEEFLDLFRVIGRNPVFTAFIGQILTLASGLIRLTKALEPLIPLLTAFAAVKLGQVGGQFVRSVRTGVTRGVHYAGGGVVPGQGSGDTVPAMLTPGEFVIKKSAAQSIGYSALAKANKYADAGKVTTSKTAAKGQALGTERYIDLPRTEKVGQIGLKGIKGDVIADTELSKSRNAVNMVEARLLRAGFSKSEIESNILPHLHLRGSVRNYVLSSKLVDNVFNKKIAPTVAKLINNIINKYKVGRGTPSYDITKSTGFNKLGGELLEGFLSVKTGTPAQGGNKPFDYEPTSKQQRSFQDIIEDQPVNSDYLDAYNRSTQRSSDEIIIKAANRGLFDNKLKNIAHLGQKKASGGSISGGTDSVPAMLTPGEFVINKGAAQRIGYGNLNRINKFADGGLVQKFFFGGTARKQKKIEKLKALLTQGGGFEGVDIGNIASKIDITKFQDPNQFGRAVLGTGEIGLGQNNQGFMAQNLAHELTHLIDTQAGPVPGQTYGSSPGGKFHKAARLARAYQGPERTAHYGNLNTADQYAEHLAHGAGDYFAYKKGRLGKEVTPVMKKFFDEFDEVVLGSVRKHAATAPSKVKQSMMASPVAKSILGSNMVGDSIAPSGTTGKFHYQAMDHTGKESRGTIPADSEAMATKILRQQGLFLTGPLVPAKPSIFSRAKKAMRGGSFLSGGMTGPPTPGQQRWEGIKGRAATIGGIAAFAAPGLAASTLGTAEQPGSFGTGGAAFGSFAGAAIGGAALGSVGGPWGALAGALVAGTTALIGFNKELDEITSRKTIERFGEAVESKSPAKVQAVTRSLVARRESIRAQEQQSSFGVIREYLPSFLGGLSGKVQQERISVDTNKRIKEEIGPAVDTALQQVKEKAAANPTKTFEQLSQEGGFDELFKEFGPIRKHEIETMKKSIEIMNKQTKAQAEVSVEFAKLALSADDLAEKMELTGSFLERSRAVREAGRGGAPTGGVGVLGIGALPGGAQLRNIGETGGLLDVAGEQVKQALLDIAKGGALSPDDLGNAFEKALNTPAFAGDIGGVLKKSILNVIGEDEGKSNLITRTTGNPLEVFQELTKNWSAIKDPVKKATESTIKVFEKLRDDSIRIQDVVRASNAELEKVYQFEIQSRKERGLTLLHNTDQHFLTREGVVTPADIRAEVQSRAAAESFAASQGQFTSVGAGIANDPNALFAGLKQAQTELQSVIARSEIEKNNPGNTENFGDTIAKARTKFLDFQDALKNLANSTTKLEAAQHKLQVALEKETADKEGRKAIGEILAFGSMEEKINLFRGQAAAQQIVEQGGFTGNIPDELKGLARNFLNTAGGAQGPNGVTAAQYYESIVNANTPASQMRQRMAMTPAGPQAVSEEVLQRQQEVRTISDTMIKAGNLINDLAVSGITEDLAHNTNDFNIAVQSASISLQQLQGTVGNILKVNPGDVGKSRGGLIRLAGGGLAPKGTDTVPAMLTPGEFVVNAGKAKKHRSILEMINAGKYPTKEKQWLNAGKYPARDLSDIPPTGGMGGGSFPYMARGGLLGELTGPNFEEEAQQKYQEKLKRKQRQGLLAEMQKKRFAPTFVGPPSPFQKNTFAGPPSPIQGNTFAGPPSPNTGIFGGINQLAGGLLGGLNRANAAATPPAFTPLGLSMGKPIVPIEQQAQQERAREIQKRQARRERAGAPQYVPLSQRETVTNAFNDPEAAQLRTEQLGRAATARNRIAAAQANPQGTPGGFGGFNRGLDQQAQQLGGFGKDTAPLVDALNNFPRQIEIKREGAIQVILNGAEIIAKMKGDLEAEVWKRIVETIQEQVPKAVNNMAPRG